MGQKRVLAIGQTATMAALTAAAGAKPMTTTERSAEQIENITATAKRIANDPLADSPVRMWAQTCLTVLAAYDDAQRRVSLDCTGEGLLDMVLARETTPVDHIDNRNERARLAYEMIAALKEQLEAAKGRERKNVQEIARKLSSKEAENERLRARVEELELYCATFQQAEM